jgi:hypothetical protein
MLDVLFHGLLLDAEPSLCMVLALCALQILLLVALLGKCSSGEPMRMCVTMQLVLGVI